MSESGFLLIYASRDGHTRKIARRLSDRLFAKEIEADLYDLADEEPSPMAWAKAKTILLMAPVRYGYALPEMRNFIRENKALIDSRTLILVNINLTARKAAKNTAATNPYMKKWIRKQGLAPALAAVFAGCLDYPRYGWFDCFMIRLIMRITGGPYDGKCVIDYTDWAAVDAFADQIAGAQEARVAA